MPGTTLVLFVVALQLLSPALSQSNVNNTYCVTITILISTGNERPIFDDDSLDISVFENHNVCKFLKLIASIEWYFAKLEFHLC